MDNMDELCFPPAGLEGTWGRTIIRFAEAPCRRGEHTCNKAHALTHKHRQTHAPHQHGVELHFPGRSKDFEAECESLLWFSGASVLSGFLFFSFAICTSQSDSVGRIETDSKARVRIWLSRSSRGFE